MNTTARRAIGSALTTSGLMGALLIGGLAAHSTPAPKPPVTFNLRFAPTTATPAPTDVTVLPLTTGSPTPVAPGVLDSNHAAVEAAKPKATPVPTMSPLQQITATAPVAQPAQVSASTPSASPTAAPTADPNVGQTPGGNDVTDPTWCKYGTTGTPTTVQWSEGGRTWTNYHCAFAH